MDIPKNLLDEVYPVILAMTLALLMTSCWSCVFAAGEFAVGSAAAGRAKCAGADVSAQLVEKGKILGHWFRVCMNFSMAHSSHRKYRLIFQQHTCQHRIGALMNIQQRIFTGSDKGALRWW